MGMCRRRRKLKQLLLLAMSRLKIRRESCHTLESLLLQPHTGIDKFIQPTVRKHLDESSLSDDGGGDDGEISRRVGEEGELRDGVLLKSGHSLFSALEGLFGAESVVGVFGGSGG